MPIFRRKTLFRLSWLTTLKKCVEKVLATCAEILIFRLPVGKSGEQGGVNNTTGRSCRFRAGPRYNVILQGTRNILG